MSVDVSLSDFTAQWSFTLSWCPSAEQQVQFQQLFAELVRLNATVNLTRITSPADFWEKHLWDSLWGVQPWLVPAAALGAIAPSGALDVIDIGTGGGFPGFPVAIALPEWHLTLLDATHKKVACLQTLSDTLKLRQVTPHCARAETIGQDTAYRDRFDLALIRAVGPAGCCAEYALPLIKQGGTAVLYRGRWDDQEAEDLQQALAQLGGELIQVQAGETPLSRSQRHCLYLKKTRPTPLQYPRAAGIPSRRPLGSSS